MVSGLLDLHSATGDIAHLQVSLLHYDSFVSISGLEGLLLGHRKVLRGPSDAPCSGMPLLTYPALALTRPDAWSPLACPLAALQWALELQRTMQELFWDPEGGAYFNNKAKAAWLMVGMVVGMDCCCMRRAGVVE